MLILCRLGNEQNDWSRFFWNCVATKHISHMLYISWHNPTEVRETWDDYTTKMLSGKLGLWTAQNMLQVHVSAVWVGSEGPTEMTRGCLDTELGALIHSISLAENGRQLQRVRVCVCDNENEATTGTCRGRCSMNGSFWDRQWESSFAPIPLALNEWQTTSLLMFSRASIVTVQGRKIETVNLYYYLCIHYKDRELKLLGKTTNPAEYEQNHRTSFEFFSD